MREARGWRGQSSLIQRQPSLSGTHQTFHLFVVVLVSSSLSIAFSLSIVLVFLPVSLVLSSPFNIS